MSEIDDVLLNSSDDTHHMYLHPKNEVYHAAQCMNSSQYAPTVA